MRNTMIKTPLFKTPLLHKIPHHLRLAVYLGCVEVGFGGLLHGLRLPLTGYILSLHQIFCLNRAVIEADTLLNPIKVSLDPIKVSLGAGFLRLSLPSTKTLTPFVALVMQGLLFNMGILLFGTNCVGRCIGAALASVWGFIQPLLILSIVFAKPMIDGLTIVNTYTEHWHLNLFMVLACIVLLKMCLAILLSLYATGFSADRWLFLQEHLLKSSVRSYFPLKKQRSRYRSFLSLWFIIPMTLSILGMCVTQHTFFSTFKMASQGIAFYLILMVGLNVIPTNKIVHFLSKMNCPWLLAPSMLGIDLLVQREEKQ